MSNTTERRWATTREVADHLGVHPNTILRWGAEGRIRRHRIGPRTVRYDLNEIDAALTRKAV